MEGELKKERNGTYENFQLLSRKQRVGEFHAVLSGFYNLGLQIKNSDNSTTPKIDHPISKKNKLKPIS